MKQPWDSNTQKGTITREEDIKRNLEVDNIKNKKKDIEKKRNRK